MLTPNYLANSPNEIVRLYAKLEVEILADIARRIKATGVVSSSAQFQIKQAQEAGLLFDEIIRQVAAINNTSKADIQQLFEDASLTSLQFDNKIFRAAGLSTLSNANAQILAAGINKTFGDIVNMTMTTASAGQQQFINASTKAYMQVASGAFDYNTATANACREVAKTGLQTIHYDSGATVSLEAGIRRNVLTGINQTAQKITEYNCDELGCDLVETSAHAGARPEHALWQGKVFSRSGKSKKYPHFANTTGYGTGPGLGGWNCRHSFYPYFEGDDLAHTKAELEALNSETVSYGGKEYTRYEAEQIERSNERNIRRFKREKAMMNAAGLDSSFASRKVREWTARAKDFTDKTSVVRQSAREKVFTGGGQSGIITIGRDNVGIDIEIDKFTPCLIESRTGKIVNTQYALADRSELMSLQEQGWKFDWAIKDLDNSVVYKLTTENDSNIQGLVALTDYKKDQAVYVNIAESAPHNSGRGKQYEGVGGHLFAVAAQISQNRGYGGFLFMDAKNPALVKYYHDKFGATLIGMPHPHRMYIDENAAKRLIEIYTLKGE